MKLQDTQTFTSVDGQPVDILAKWHPITRGQLVIFDDHGRTCIGRVVDTDGTMEVWHNGVKDWVWTGYTTRRARMACAIDLVDHDVPLKYINGELKTDAQNLIDFRANCGLNNA